MTDLIACVHAGQSAGGEVSRASANTSRCTGTGYGNAQQRNRYAASTRARR
jgi:hypothetical protein